MTLIEHYLRTNFNILPNSQLIKELLNYLQDRGYEVDMSKMISESDAKEVLYLRRPEGTAIIYQPEREIDEEDEDEDQIYFQINESKKVRNPESPLYSQEVKTLIDISVEDEIPSIGIIMKTNDKQFFIEIDNDTTPETFKGHIESQLTSFSGVFRELELDDINGMVPELASHHILLSLVYSSTKKAFESRIRQSKEKEKTK